jgi:putative ATP-binding cassette transporter
MGSLVRVLTFLSRRSGSYRPSRGALATVVLAGMISGAASAGFIALINTIIKSGNHRPAALAWTFVALCLALPVFRFLASFLLLRLSNRAVMELRLELSRGILSAPLRKLEELGAPRLLASLTDDVGALVGAVSATPTLVIQITIVLGCLLYLGWLSWSLLLLVVLTAAVGVATYELPMLKAQRYFGKSRRDWDHLFQHFRSLTQGTKELKIHRARRDAFVRESLQGASESLMRNSISGSVIYDAVNSWGQALFFVLIGVVLFVLPQVRPVDKATLTGYTLAILFMVTPLDTILHSLPTLGRASVAIGRIEELSRTLAPEAQDGGAAAPPAPWKSLQLMGVTHAYHRENEDEVFALGPIDLTLRPGELVFLVGGNGSGKTTLAKLLIGLYAPEEGRVLLDGEPVRDGNLESYRQMFSVVFSDFYLFESLLGLGEVALDERARHYLAQLHLDRKVKVTNGSLSTLDLSQGQRKRLALLTAYLEDRPIYLFDEWAADQDPSFKEVFYRQILPDLKRRGKTVVVISHDDRYFPVADRIIKLADGRIATGELAELAATSYEIELSEVNV